MTSPPSMPHPSPSGGLMPASPLNPQPSPMAAHSPGPNLAYMQNHPDSSPFGVLSPAATGSNWPGSPGMPRPSPRPGQSPEHKSQTHGNDFKLSLLLFYTYVHTLHSLSCIPRSARTFMGRCSSHTAHRRSSRYAVPAMPTSTEGHTRP